MAGGACPSACESIVAEQPDDRLEPDRQALSQRHESGNDFRTVKRESWFFEPLNFAEKVGSEVEQHDSERPADERKGHLSTSSSYIRNLKEISPERWESFVLVSSPLNRFWIQRKGVHSQAIDDIRQDSLRTFFFGNRSFRAKRESWLVPRLAADGQAGASNVIR